MTNGIVTDWTLEEFLRLPETKPALEYEAGKVTQKVSPTTEHSVLQKHLVKMLDALEVGQAFPELRTVLPTASKVPDVAFYVTAELPLSPTRRWLRYPEWAPTIAIEIASPDQDLDELRDKSRFYIREGSRLAILAVPETEMLELFSAGDITRDCRGDDAIDELVDVLGPGARTITPAATFAALHP
jgi:Uma2 family endonuclease